jgi:hypothetical protein
MNKWIIGWGRIGAAQCAGIFLAENAMLGSVMSAEKFWGLGSATFEGKTSIQRIRQYGLAVFHDAFACEKMTIIGKAFAEKGLQVAELKLSGSFMVGGKVQATEIHLNIKADSRVADLEADVIVVKSCAKIELDTVIGTHVYLENVHANKVSGNAVCIGGKSVIQEVEAARVSVGPNAFVHQVVRKKS